MKITNELLLERKQHLKNNMYAENTIQNYYSDMKLFMKFICVDEKLETIGYTIPSEKITLGKIEGWKKVLLETPTPRNSIYWTKRPTLSPQTIQWKLNAIKSFLKFLNIFYDEWIDYRKIILKKIKSDYIESITETEFQLFMNFIGSYEKYRINALRSQLLINIGYTSGLRLSEMLGLTVQQVKAGECRITGKGNKTRWVFFTTSSNRLLDEYLEERNKPIPRTWKTENYSDFVFISHNSGYDYWQPIKKNTVCEKVKKYSDCMNLGKRITVHSLRHGYATRLLESWMNIREIQELLGHKDIQTTESYCHILKSWLKNKVAEIFH